ncbi:pentapeptide repeat-containing protein [Streptomyces bathyalis]|uniref:Pentapeptide repeat-containing protein n=1 Tax=Streptomyces bathyalis TaxID=2710756 RepID=A0A7T1T707_9ACTN|nr:pentapeptide repeat-containing protein [Streptomyces bathyalis]QPP07551.1 pentapeptide repeat-containing protein [Streptomyces bathyalis]
MSELLAAISDPNTQKPQLGEALFTNAVFDDDARFAGADFQRFAGFTGATFGDNTDFAAATFEDLAGFSGATFGDNTNFRAAVFQGRADFPGVIFGETTVFIEVIFDSFVAFGATFGGWVSFEQAIFLVRADFSGVTFGDYAWFERASFGENSPAATPGFNEYINFSRSAFGNNAWFLGATFHERAQFARASFNDFTWFAQAIFHGEAVFERATLGDGSIFTGATFNQSAEFRGATFGKSTTFTEVTFEDGEFASATFGGSVNLSRTTFRESASFSKVTFQGNADFAAATFGANTTFTGANFQENVQFEGTTFCSNTNFDEVSLHGAFNVTKALFQGDVSFREAQLGRASNFGPLVCSSSANLSGMEFEGPVTIEVAARRVEFRGTRWAATGAIWVRYAEVDLTDAFFEYPLSVTSRRSAFKSKLGEEIDESSLTGGWKASVKSIQGVDAAHLILNDLDLTSCLFSGAVHLDQLRLEGEYTLRPTPPRWHRRGAFPMRWSRRYTLAEEQHWRTAEDWAGWQAPAPSGYEVLTPAALAPLYRQLRKSLEDGKDEPGAADFYYGEMEMRRNNVQRPRSERLLLHLYWALSGYGLRATRALTWLTLAMGATLVALMGWGLPKHEPKPTITGEVTHSRARLISETPDPMNSNEPLLQRFTTNRFEKSLRVVINSVVFRSSGQNLTTIGTYVEMTSRFAVPTLLGLSALAIRSRVKR